MLIYIRTNCYKHQEYDMSGGGLMRKVLKNICIW